MNNIKNSIHNQKRKLNFHETSLLVCFCPFYVFKTLNKSSTTKKHKTDPALNVEESKSQLNNSAQKQKLSVKPKKRHVSSHRSVNPKKYSPKPGER